jgi:hypothetical protein
MPEAGGGGGYASPDCAVADSVCDALDHSANSACIKVRVGIAEDSL